MHLLEEDSNFETDDDVKHNTEELVEHLKTANNKLLSQAKKYKSECESKERLIKWLRSERKRIT